ncbi:MAG: hypothetical protein AAFR51_03740 [Pseudomonadota bacterium]
MPVLILILVAFGLSFGAAAQSSPSKAQIEQATMAFLEAQTEAAHDTLASLLAAYDGPPSVQSVNAHLTLLAYDGPGENVQRLQQTAGAATLHLEPVAEILPKQYLAARFHAAMAEFNAEKAENAAYEMAHIQGRSGEIDNRGVWPDWAKAQHYQAKAWALAMLAELKADAASAVSQAAYDEVLAAYAPIKAAPAEYGALPKCKGEMRNRARLNAPKISGKRGQWGALILEYDLDQDGRVINETVLAAVPAGAFEQNGLKWLKRGRFRAEDRDEIGVTCRLNRRGIVQDLVFQID